MDTNLAGLIRSYLKNGTDFPILLDYLKENYNMEDIDKPVDEYEEYWNTIEAIAKEIIEDSGDEEHLIHESVDGSSYIIYYDNNQIVLDSTRNYPAGDDVKELIDKGADWEKFRQLTAYLAMAADVRDEIIKLRGENDVEESD